MKIFTLPLIVAVLSFAGCNSEPTAPDAPGNEEKETETVGEPKDEDMIGLTVEDAEAVATERGLQFRIISVDGDVRPVTMEYLPTRVSFTVEKGKIVKVTRG